MSYEKRRRFLWILFLIGTVILAIAARATTLRQLGFSELVRLSPAIARVKCVGSETVLERGEIWTDTRFQLLKQEKGILPAQILVRQLGGNYQHLQSRVDGTPAFTTGEELFVFLSGPAENRFRLTGWTQGTFRVHKDSRTGRETVTQDSAGTPLFDPQSHEFRKTGVKDLRVDLFEEKMRQEIRGR
jgi:hypothetical protein